MTRALTTHTVLAEFRGRVAGAGLEQVVLDALLARLVSEGLVKAGGKQRTDSTRVVAAVAALTRLQLAAESVLAALEALAAHPAWLGQRVYGLFSHGTGGVGRRPGDFVAGPGLSQHRPVPWLPGVYLIGAGVLRHMQRRLEPVRCWPA
jgi:hypothetical protein